MPSNKPVQGQVIHKADLDSYLYKGSDEVVEGGQYYDFHKVGSTADFDARLGINNDDNSLIITNYNGVRLEANTKLKGDIATAEGSNIKLGPIQPSIGDGGNIHFKAGIANADNVQSGNNGAIVRTFGGKNSNFTVITIPVLDNNNSGSTKYYSGLSLVNNLNENKDGLYSTDVYIGSTMVLGVINPTPMGETTTPIVMRKDGKVLFTGDLTTGSITLSESLYHFDYVVIECLMSWQNTGNRFYQSQIVYTDYFRSGTRVMFNNSSPGWYNVLICYADSTNVVIEANESQGLSNILKRITGYRRIHE